MIVHPHRSLEFSQFLLILFGKVAKLHVHFQGLEKFMDGRHDQVHPPQVGLQIHGLLPRGQLQVFEASDAFECQVRNRRDRKNGTEIQEK